MRAFEISEPAIIKILEGLIVGQFSGEDRSLRSRLQDMVWDETVILGANGLALEAPLITRCRTAIAHFFDLDLPVFEALQADRPLGDWASAIAASLCKKMVQLNFRPAVPRGTDVVCTHRFDALFQEAAAVASLLQGRRRLVSFVSAHSLVGFVLTVLVPTLQKIDRLDARLLAPEDIATTLAHGDVIVATPSLWSYFVRERIEAPTNTMGVSFGEVMAGKLADNMRRFGIGVLRELYGSTETGIVGWRDSSTDKFLLFDHWSRSGRELCRTMPDGSAISVAPMDHLDWETDRTFSLGGRRDGAVQIGAVNVFPDWIASVIAEHRSVERCTIRFAEDANGTARLIANIWLKSGVSAGEASARDIDTWTRSRLSLHERPHIYHFYHT